MKKFLSLAAAAALMFTSPALASGINLGDTTNNHGGQGGAGGTGVGVGIAGAAAISGAAAGASSDATALGVQAQKAVAQQSQEQSQSQANRQTLQSQISTGPQSATSSSTGGNSGGNTLATDLNFEAAASSAFAQGAVGRKVCGTVLGFGVQKMGWGSSVGIPLPAPQCNARENLSAGLAGAALTSNPSFWADVMMEAYVLGEKPATVYRRRAAR